jgi:hypothetical protein
MRPIDHWTFIGAGTDNKTDKQSSRQSPSQIPRQTSSQTPRQTSSQTSGQQASSRTTCLWDFTLLSLPFPLPSHNQSFDMPYPFHTTSTTKMSKRDGTIRGHHNTPPHTTQHSGMPTETNQKFPKIKTRTPTSCTHL